MREPDRSDRLPLGAQHAEALLQWIDDRIGEITGSETDAAMRTLRTKWRQNNDSGGIPPEVLSQVEKHQYHARVLLSRSPPDTKAALARTKRAPHADHEMSQFLLLHAEMRSEEYGQLPEHIRRAVYVACATYLRSALELVGCKILRALREVPDAVRLFPDTVAAADEVMPAAIRGAAVCGAG